MAQKYKNALAISCLTYSEYTPVNWQSFVTLLTKIESFCPNDFPVMPNRSLAQVRGRWEDDLFGIFFTSELEYFVGSASNFGQLQQFLRFQTMFCCFGQVRAKNPLKIALQCLKT